MCSKCSTSFGYPNAHQLFGIPFNSEFIHTSLDYLDSLPNRKDDWRFEDEWAWIVTGCRINHDDRIDSKYLSKEHEGVWTHYLEHAYPKKYFGRLGCPDVCEYETSQVENK